MVYIIIKNNQPISILNFDRTYYSLIGAYKKPYMHGIAIRLPRSLLRAPLFKGELDKAFEKRRRPALQTVVK